MSAYGGALGSRPGGVLFALALDKCLGSMYLDPMTTARYYTEFVDGTFAVCVAQDADEALDIMSRSTEMLHGPIQGEPPADDPDLVDDFGGQA